MVSEAPVADHAGGGGGTDEEEDEVREERVDVNIARTADAPASKDNGVNHVVWYKVASA